VRHHQLAGGCSFIQFAGAAVLAVGATATIYLSYLLGNIAVMRARTKGWPRRRRRSRSACGEGREHRRDLVGRGDDDHFLWPSSASSAFDRTRRCELPADLLEPEVGQSDYYVEDTR
jgi:hypothetical protein